MPFNPEVVGWVVAAIFTLMTWSTARDNRRADERYWRLDAERRAYQSRERWRPFDRYQLNTGLIVTTTSTWMGLPMRPPADVRY
jgi:hypothetical protein